VRNPTNVDPYDRARQLLERFQISGSPTPLESIAKKAGAQVRFSPLDAELSGMIFIKDNVPIIGVNSLHHPNRQRFTMAHELGHLELHRDMLLSQVHVDKDFPGLMRDSVSATGMELKEIQANQFAAELLMPKALLDQALGSRKFDIDDERPLEDLAKKFRVSKQALMYRIRNMR
jgi:Zn-dependent peptidase ImmA (M78 family)